MTMPGLVFSVYFVIKSMYFILKAVKNSLAVTRESVSMLVKPSPENRLV